MNFILMVRNFGGCDGLFGCIALSNKGYSLYTNSTTVVIISKHRNDDILTLFLVVKQSLRSFTIALR